LNTRYRERERWY
jgi:hypothetical protein